MHCGVITDCPHRERIGYTGDAQNTAESAMLTLSCKDIYEKYIRDIADTQDKNTGHIQHTAPFFGGGWCLGEWATPEKPVIPAEFVNTYFLIKSLQLLKEIAAIIGENSDLFSEIEEICKKAMYTAFYDTEFHSFCKGVNGADAFAADIGIADTKCINGLNIKYSTQKLDTRIFGTDILINTLFKNGFEDTAFKLLTEEGKYTFSDHMNHGATTLWENWNGIGSHNHHMHGAVTGCLFYHILGMNIGKKTIIEPKIPKKLNSAEGSVKT